MNPITLLRIEKNRLARNRGDSIASIKDLNRMNRLCVLSNGPSLIQSINDYKNDMLESDTICMNSFPNSDYFSELKPRYYTLFDPLYFNDLSQVYNNGETVKKLVEEIKEKVTWDLTVVVPEYTKTTPFIHEIKKNSQISIKYCSDFCVSFDGRSRKQERALFGLLKNDMISVPSQTVSCAAIAFGVFWGYQEIDVFGLDMSMFKGHYIDQKTNQGFLTADHFYNSDSNDKNSREYTAHSSLAWYLKAYSMMFYQMEFIDRYAKYYGITIKNKSAFSYVDAFERE